MSLPFTATLAPLDPTRTCRELLFVETAVDLKQARFKDRRILIPQIDLASYRYQAVIDFVVTMFGLGNPASDAICNCDFFDFNSSTRRSMYFARPVSA